MSATTLRKQQDCIRYNPTQIPLTARLGAHQPDRRLPLAQQCEDPAAASPAPTTGLPY